jgi:Lon-like protease
MTRRSATLSVAGALIVALLAVATLLPVPYVIYSPGWLEDTLGERDGVPVVQIGDQVEHYETDGTLELTTVAVTSADAELDLLSVLNAWLDADRAVVPRHVVYRDGETAEESREQSARQLARSQETAKVAALRELGHEVSEQIVVTIVFDDTPADGVLEPGDIILSVDGTDVGSPEEVAGIVTDRQPGDTVDLGIRRGGEEQTVTADTTPAEDDGRPVVGFQPDWGYELPVDISIAIDERIGGPSAGMIFALAIYDRMTEESLIEGRHIAGSGEITGNDEVGSVGGIAQKIAASNQAGAELFLTPVGTCGEVADANNGDMHVAPVETLTEAIDTIEALTDGDVADLPTC